MSLEKTLLGDRPQVVVIGAGVVGVGTALALLQKAPYCKVTVYASEMSPDTTGDAVAGFWYPYITGRTPEDKICKWSEETWNLFRSWQRSGSPEVVKCGAVILDDKPMPKMKWFRICKDLIYLSQEELKEYGDRYMCGLSFSTFVCQPEKFLPYLMNSVGALGGRFVKRKITNLEEFDGVADIVINCSGLGARELAQDEDVTPVRGQVMRVRAPWLKMCFMDLTEDNHCYVLVNVDSVVLGGTHQENNWSTEICPRDKEEILEKCTRIFPSIKHATILKDWTGLRPMRSQGVRLEIDQRSFNSKGTTVIHNYGHGGSGITFFWGCAKEAADLVLDVLASKNSQRAKL